MDSPEDQQSKLHRVIVLSSPKGGTGKTTFAENFLAISARDGFLSVGIDFDPQQSLTKWWKRRQVTADKRPNVSMFDVLPATIDEWPLVMDTVSGYEIVVVDMMPSVDPHRNEVRSICEMADLTLVTTGCTTNDLDSTLPWLAMLNKMGFRVAACMNRTDRRETFTEVTRAELHRHGHLCPIDVRRLAEVHQPAIDGLAAVDILKSRSAQDFEAVWEYVKRACGLQRELVSE